MADHHDGPPVKPRQSTHNRVVIGEISIPRQRRVLREQRLDVVFAMGTIRVTRDLAFAPRGQVAVEAHQQIGRLFIKRLCLGLDVHVLVRTGQRAQFGSFAFNLGQRPFKIEVVGHVGRLQ